MSDPAKHGVSPRWRVVATGPWDRPGWSSILEAGGCEVIVGTTFDQSPGPCYNEDQLIDLLHDADAALVSSRDAITAKVLQNLPRLNLVAKATIGVEKIDRAAATELGILVVNSPAPENFLGVAEATVGLMISLAKRVNENQRRVREGKWKAPGSLGSLLLGKTVGIIGLGRVGMNVAKRLSGFGVRLIAADPYVEPAMAFAVGVELVTLDELVREADFITCHVTLTPETRQIINEERLRAMQPHTYLVNTSRGEVVDEAALAHALNEGWIAGAALDVFEDEPLAMSNPLRGVNPDRIILTPHCVGGSLASQATGTRMASENILRALRGDVPNFVTNRAAIERWRTRIAALSADRSAVAAR